MSQPQYEFLVNKEEFECSICTLVLTMPVQTRCCGAVFCKSCIEQWCSPPGQTAARRSGSTGSCCPNCRASLQYYDDKRMDRAIKNLHVTCSNHRLGCKWTGELRNLTGHLSSTTGCDHQVVPCPKQCGEHVLRSHLKNHVEEDCIHRKTKCLLCQMTGSYSIINGSHLNECPKAKVHCPNGCSKSSILRFELQDHIKQCPLEVVACEYANAGCHQCMARKDIEIHRVTGMSHHLNLVNKKLSQLLEHLQCRDHIAPIVLKVSEYAKQENWNSPCFYTHCNGYKLQLTATVRRVASSVLVNNANSGFLSVAVALTEGPFDDHLSWPICARISVRLLNQVRNSQHHSVMFQLEKQRQDMAPTSIERFIDCRKLNSLSNSQVQFLVGDCLYFQVIVELLGDCQPKPWLSSALVLT